MACNLSIFSVSARAYDALTEYKVGYSLLWREINSSGTDLSFKLELEGQG